MSADLYDKCMSTCKNNNFEIDEIKAAGLTSVKAEMVNAPLIDECFMNLECRFKWEKEIVEGDDYVYSEIARSKSLEYILMKDIWMRTILEGREKREFFTIFIILSILRISMGQPMIMSVL